MHHNDDLLKEKSVIYKYLAQNPLTHRNVLRKKLLAQGKISSKNKFSLALNELIALGKVSMIKENVFINENVAILGVIQRNGDDFYVVTQNSNKYYPIDKNVAAGYKSGDVINVVLEDGNGKKEAIILGKTDKQFEQKMKVGGGENLDNYPQTPKAKENLVLGRVVKLSHDNLVFIPNKKSFSTRQIPILNNKEEWAKFQDKLCIMDLVDIEAPLLGGHIVSVKGDAGNPIHEYDAIAESYGGIMSWEGENIEKEIDNIPETVDVSSLNLISEAEAKENQRGNVVDLRNIPFSTIDPATCKDMDDAIYSTFNQNGDYVCYTAVANVTKYVDLHTEIGKRYINGGFTIYAPNKAYNILPTKLSTGICSLNPNEDRLAFVIKTVIDKNTGDVKDSRIFDAVIRSRKKYSYEEAQEIVDRTKDEISASSLLIKNLTKEELSEDEQIVMNYYAAKAIKNGFERRKMIRFVSNKERDVVFDADLQTVVDIKPVPHLYYHEVIEAFMVTANEATAKYARDNSLDNIFRVHDEPNPQKVDRATEFFNILGIDFDGDLSAEGTRGLIELIRDTANEEIINKFLIKMQSRAKYSDHLYGNKKNKNEEDENWMGERISHYALQSKHYSHTTSPIRRVPDYITQYNILANMHGTKPISAKEIVKIVDIANERQLDVDQAEKDFEDINSVMYCEKHIGETMSGRVTKIRTASIEEGFEDDIIVIVKNEEKGINAEIPLSQILGRQSNDCVLSEQRCAVYDRRGNIVLTICKPIDFIIEKADRKTMRVIGRTNKELVRSAEKNENKDYRHHNKHISAGHNHSKQKSNRAKRFEEKRNHNTNSFEDDGPEMD